LKPGSDNNVQFELSHWRRAAREQRRVRARAGVSCVHAIYNLKILLPLPLPLPLSRSVTGRPCPSGEVQDRDAGESLPHQPLDTFALNDRYKPLCDCNSDPLPPLFSNMFWEYMLEYRISTPCGLSLPSLPHSLSPSLYGPKSSLHHTHTHTTHTYDGINTEMHRCPIDETPPPCSLLLPLFLRKRNQTERINV
jgi:hypothetical protein